MKAVKCSAYGTSSVLNIVTTERKQVKHNEIAIQMKATTVTPVDIAFRLGQPFISRFFSGLSKPKYIPGDIVAGQVIEVGSDVKRFKVGDRVFGHTGTSFGALAEVLVTDENQALIQIPEAMTFEEAASLAYSGMTAKPFLLDEVTLEKGKILLINGISGSIGSSALQIAKSKGLYVIGVCGPDNVDRMIDLGADEIINYKEEDFTSRPGAYDYIFDVVGKSDFKKVKSSLRLGGSYMTTVPSLNSVIAGMTTKNKDKHGKFVATGLRKVDMKMKDLKDLISFYNQGILKPQIDSRYLMEEIREAHNKVETGHTKGHVIIQIQ